MVKNDIELDVKLKLVAAKMTQQKIADEIGTTGQYVNRLLKKNTGIVNDTLVRMMDALGYDIVLTYVPKEE